MTVIKEAETTAQIEMTALTEQIEMTKPGMQPSAANVPRARGWLAVLGTLAALAALFAVAMLPRWRANAALENAVRDQRPAVSVVSPERANANADLALPGSTQAIQETAIYARTNGYVRRWLVDIGAKVEAGQLLAEIETPEVDQELNQALASREQAAANLELARATLKRWQDLLQKKVVSAQEFDEKKAGFNARQADFNAAQANVKRLEETQAFQKIVAPFSGIVTARNVDSGMLVSAGSSNQSAALFRIAQTDPLRIFVTVPQSYARSIAAGQNAAVSFREIPDRTFPAKVVRTTGALDPASRTLLTELQVPNADGQLLPGMFAEIKFALPQDGRTLLIPGNAVIIRADGPKVMTVDAQRAIRFRPVKLGRDLGDKVEILSGLDAGDSLVANPSDALREGAEVKVQTQPSKNSDQQTKAKPTEEKS
jgi:membrane fusion protein, multidrug efflux system